MRATPTVYDVARLAGVSTATVSRVISGNDRVLAHTRERVLTAVAELGYVPSGAAKDLAARRTGVLGMCFPDLVGDQDIADSDAMYWYDEVIRGMERAARRSGYAILIAASHASDDVNLVLSVAGRCDGLVVLARTVPARMLEHIAMRIPVVLLASERERDEISGVLDHLWVANGTGAYAVTAHLADHHGHRDIAFAAGPADSPDSTSRYDGYRKALSERGLAPSDPPLRGDFTTAGGRRVAAEIMCAGAGRRPRALVCANDQTAIGAMAALQSAGLRVPEDIALTGFDGISLGEHLRPSLTTVVQPMRGLGETAVRLLQNRMADPALGPRAIELPVRLELRASCGCPEPAPKTLMGRAIPGGTSLPQSRQPSEASQ
ncbi:MAG TPA: LacI family DNA-binding transcriptional regulator [Streptosporangiaceae bacterium]|jgi:LacI family transcriptional regulator